MKACKVSIILPVYNTSKYLDCCMESLLNQTLNEIEIIAVNDGSTDNSLEILKGYQAKYPEKVYVYNTENHGVSHARNFGVSKSCGEFLWFVDSDDFVELDACQRLYDKAAKDNNDLVLFSRYDVNDETGEKTGNKTFHFNQNFKMSDNAYELVKLSPFPWNKFIRKDLFDGVKFPEKIRFEDLPISFILATRAKNIGIINDYLYNYRVQVGFLSKFTESTLDIQKAVDFLKATLEKDGTFNIYKEEIEYVTMRHFFYRFEQLQTVYGEYSYELKIKLINTLFDYLNANYPNRENNAYLHYNLPDRIYKLLSFYSSRDALLKYADKCRFMSADEQNAYNEKFETEHTFPKKKKQKGFKEIKNKGADLSLIFHEIQANAAIENNTLFISSKSKGISSTLLSMMIYLNKNGVHTAVYTKDKCDEINKILSTYRLNDTEIINKKSDRYLNTLAKSKYIIADCPLDYFFVKTDGQIYINVMTDRISPKVIFNSTKNKFDFPAMQKSLITADYTLYCNNESKTAFETAYKTAGLNTNYISGIFPADDINDNIVKLRAETNANGKQIITIVPQYRDGADRVGIRAFRKLMTYMLILDRKLSDNQEAYIYLGDYPFDADLSIFKHIKAMPVEYDLYDFIDVSNVVITDYHPLLLGQYSDKAIRLIVDDKLYIDNEFYTNSACTHICHNATELAQAINSFNSTNTISNNNNCQKLFDMINNGFKQENSNEKFNVLYYLGGNVSLSKIKKFKALIRENPNKNYWLAFDEEKNNDYKNELLELFKSRNYIPIRFDNSSSFEEKIVSAICKKSKLPFGSKKKYAEQKAMEWKKYFGNVKFDEITLISTGEIERNLLFIGASPITNYSFNWFSKEKYDSKKAFKRKVDYICKELQEKAVVEIPEEMQSVKAIKNLKIVDKIQFSDQIDHK